MRSRLSKLASDRLTDNNPNIADLSDANRPTKLGEMFGELYDNQWTDAFESLTSGDRRTEREAVTTLLNIVQVCYKIKSRPLCMLKECNDRKL